MATVDPITKRQFSVNVDEDHYDVVQRHARARRVSVALVIREAIAEWIARHQAEAVS